MRFRGGEFSTGTMRNFQPELTPSLRWSPWEPKKRLARAVFVPQDTRL